MEVVNGDVTTRKRMKTPVNTYLDDEVFRKTFINCHGSGHMRINV